MNQLELRINLLNCSFNGGGSIEVYAELDTGTEIRNQNELKIILYEIGRTTLHPFLPLAAQLLAMWPRK